MLFSPDDLLTALPRLRRYARLLVADVAHADEVVEATLTRARRIERESSRTPTTLRLLALLRSVYVEEFAPGTSRGSRSRAIDGTACASESSGSGSGDLVAQFFRLPFEQREVLALVAVERMSYEEIAVLLAIPVATVFARLVAARQALHPIAANSERAR
jgi:RNA polymerase sigma-70 factor (ECF subfamily)